MDQLVASTIKYGLIPPVVMEFPGITVGGAFAGTAGESSSFKYGLFDRNVTSIEMILGDGEIVQASKDNNADLFYGAAGTLGTLGLVTMLELDLIEAKRFVKITYLSRPSIKSTLDLIQKEASNLSLDFVDGILFSKDHGVVITGEMTNEKPGSTQTFSHSTDPWFYLHVQEKTQDFPSPVTEFVPLPEYLFRYDRGGFWVGRFAFDYFNFPFNKHTRRILDDFLHTRMLYQALHASNQASRYVIQDIAVPYSTAEDFVRWNASTLGIWPLWLCPIQQSLTPSFNPHLESGRHQADGKAIDQIINIGLWGPGPQDPSNFGSYHVALERSLQHQFHGLKWLYGLTYYREDEFWEVYSKPPYDALRNKYRATTLPSVYDKVKINYEERERKKNEWGTRALSLRPLGGLWGIAKAIKSGEYQPRCPPWRSS
ncbi:FAD-binding protein, partial [Hypoxylon rubiginosum]